MSRISLSRGGRCALAATLLAVGLPAFAADEALPPAHTVGAVKYVTGGVGWRESQALLQDRDNHPLSVELYQRDAGHDVYTAGAEVKVLNPQGSPVLQAASDGPFLLADLPPGRYTVVATPDGQTYRKAVVVHEGANARAVFVFGPRA